MPLYDYACPCGHEDIEVFSMSTENTVMCPKCKKWAYTKQVSGFKTDLKNFHTPIELYSIALNHDDEIAEFKKKAPDVEISTDEYDPMYGIPIAANRKQKLAALAAVKFVERN